VDHLRGARPAGVRGRRFALCQNFAGGRFSAGIHHGTCCDLSGGFATHMPAHESACFPIPSDVTFEEAALADPFSVCLHAVHKAPPRRGETVVVVGCGALGMLLIHLVSATTGPSGQPGTSTG